MPETMKYASPVSVSLFLFERSNEMVYDVLIVGAGVIGGMLARELSKYRLSVCLLEKENDVACGASRANSGIIHGGYDPEPGTLKAKLNVEGVDLLFQAAEELHVPVKNNGSMVCAFSAEENRHLQMLYARGQKNGVPGLMLLSGDEARELEPALSDEITMVLRVTNAGIVCPYELTIAAIGNAMDNGVELKREFSVARISENGQGFTVTSEAGECVQGKFLVNCAGGYADKIAAMAGDAAFSIIPRAGEYMLLDKNEGSTVKHTLFQVPTSAGKGILVSPTVDGNLLLGPTATCVASPESRDTTPEGLSTVCSLAAKTVPSVNFRQAITSFTGVRATGDEGEFVLKASEIVPGLIHAGAIDSPGLTCCVSIAKYLVDILAEQGLQMENKENWCGQRQDPHAFRKMSLEEKNAFIKENPAYGKIICRCEEVTEGEILAAIRNNPPARDLDGIKRRTRSGMGRCQGGFCVPYVMELLSKEMGIPMENVTKSGSGSYMVTGKIGEEV